MRLQKTPYILIRVHPFQKHLCAVAKTRKTAIPMLLVWEVLSYFLYHKNKLKPTEYTEFEIRVMEVKSTPSINYVLLVTPCFLTLTREFIHTHHRNTTRDRRPSVDGMAMISVDKFPYPQKQTRVTNWSHAQTIHFLILKRFHSFEKPSDPINMT